MTSCIHFIRHGITEGILNKWFYGWADLPLVEEGSVALEELKAEDIYPKLTEASFYTSGMLRADQTLKKIYGHVPFTAIPDLREMNFGKWECKTLAELQELEGFENWATDVTGTFTFPGGESSKTFYERVSRGLEELVGYHRLTELSNRHSGKDSVSVMVCHGGVIAAAMCILMKQPQETFWDWIPAPGRGYTFYFEDGQVTSYENL